MSQTIFTDDFYEDVAIYATNTVAGAIGLGVPGAVAGFVSTFVDNMLIKYRYADHYYLSYFMHGVSLASGFKVSKYVLPIGGLLNLSLFY